MIVAPLVRHTAILAAKSELTRQGLIRIYLVENMNARPVSKGDEDGVNERVWVKAQLSCR
jgi:hypothetical protein